MAVIVVDEEQQQDTNPEASDKAPQQQQEQSPPAKPPVDDGPTAASDDLPEKFKGKSATDIAKAYVELERNLGRQANELGELRRTYDEIIRSSLKPSKKDEPPKPETDDDSEFFLNPRAAVKKMLQEDEVIRELREHKAETQAERSTRLIREKHPDVDTVVNDPAFRDWVGKSQVRQAMFLHAHKNFDAAAGDELLSTWKELKAASTAKASSEAAAATAAAEEAKQRAREGQLKAGVMPTGNAAPDASDGKKVFRRADLIRMQINDPDKYAALSDEILAAYAEGRVR